jgi:spore maturation protein CgeB
VGSGGGLGPLPPPPPPDAVIVGSFVHEGARIIDRLVEAEVGPLHFYDIDTPVTVARLRIGRAEYLRRDQVPLFATYLSFTGGPFLDDVLMRELGARDARPLYCSVDAERYVPVPANPDLAAELAYMGTFAEDRQPVVDRLLVEPARRLGAHRFLIAGPQYPADAGWPVNVRHIEHLPPSRHAEFYASSAWQLNATRSDMVSAGWSPSVRLFEAAACGAALISDRWPGIESFLTPGDEVLLPGSAEEAVDILLGTPAGERRRIGGAARARILAEHTSRHRAAELEALLTPTPTPA